MMNPGEEKAWSIIQGRSIDDVCASTLALYDEQSGFYTVRMYATDIQIDVQNRIIRSEDPSGEVLLKKLAYFSRLSVLWYLAGASGQGLLNSRLKLEQFKGGDIFTRGSHTLPLAALAAKYSDKKSEFLERGRILGGAVMEEAADASVVLWPLPKCPTYVSLWFEDVEFPAEARILFDASSDTHLPVDIMWSVAMMSILIL